MKLTNKQLRAKRMVNKSVEQIRAEKYQEALFRQYAAVLSVLHDKHGFGKKRLETFMTDTLFTVGSMTDNYVTKNDIFQMLYDETGFNFPEFMNERA